MRLAEKWFKQTLQTLNLTTSLKKQKGFTRLSFSKEEKEAHKQFRKLAEQLGMETRVDQVGNSWARLQVDDELPTIGFGSHLDSVENGGAFDGVAGIVCALGVVETFKKERIKPPCNIVIIAFISEESARFGLSTIGSKTIVGDVDKKKWEQIVDQAGISIRQAMEDYGISWESFHQAKHIPFPIDKFIELHIEQGRQLERKNKDVGIVTGIATPTRLKITIKGEANHTGTTLMHERRDAFVAAAPIVTYVDRLAKDFNKDIADPLVATVSTVNLVPNAINVIPGKVSIGIDIRSVDESLKGSFVKELQSFIQEHAKKVKASISVETTIQENAVLLDEQINRKMISCCQQLGISYQKMISGAGHDAMNMAKRWPTSMVFIPSKNGISHHPKEYTPLRYLQSGTELLTQYVLHDEEGET